MCANPSISLDRESVMAGSRTTIKDSGSDRIISRSGLGGGPGGASGGGSGGGGEGCTGAAAADAVARAAAATAMERRAPRCTALTRVFARAFGDVVSGGARPISENSTRTTPAHHLIGLTHLACTASHHYLTLFTHLKPRAQPGETTCQRNADNGSLERERQRQRQRQRESVCVCVCVCVCVLTQCGVPP